MMRAVFCALVLFVPSACLAAPLGTLLITARLLLNRVGHDSRVWIDSSGKYRTEAALVSRNADSVVLRRADGLVVTVPLKRLSAQDRRYVDEASPASTDMPAKARGIAGAMRSPNGAAPHRAPQESQRRSSDAGVLPADLIYVHISDRMLRRQISRPVTRQNSVNEVIVGTPVSGTAGTAGRVDLRLVPADDRGIVDLLFHGQVHSRTTGFGGPVQVHSSSVTNFSAVKRLFLDEFGIEMVPARVAAQTSSSIHGVSTSLPRLRGRIARRIGSQRATDLKPAAEAEAARKAEIRIGREFDGDVTRQLRSANGRLSEALAALPLDADLFRGRLRFASSGEYLQVAIHRAGGRVSPAPPPSPASLGSPELVVHVRGSLVERVVRDTDLQERVEPLLRRLLEQNSPQLVGMLAAESQVSLKQSGDGEWWSLVVGGSPAFQARRTNTAPARFHRETLRSDGRP
jgi:hypothetical protein